MFSFMVDADRDMGCSRLLEGVASRKCSVPRPGQGVEKHDRSVRMFYFSMGSWPRPEFHMTSRRGFLIQTGASSLFAATATRIDQAADRATDTPLQRGMSTYGIPRTNLVISRIAYGCATITSWDRNPIKEDDVVKAGRLINTAYDAGINFFDLADHYGLYKAEVVFGEVLKQSPGLRHKIVVQSKCGIVVGTDAQPGGRFRPNSSGEHIVSSANDSLRRLRTDYLDLLLLHWPDILVKPEEVAKAFSELKHSGKVRHFGVSNYTGSQIALLSQSLEQPLVVNQLPLSLASSALLAGGLSQIWTDVQGAADYSEFSTTLDYCRAHNIQLQAYSPLRGSWLKPPPQASSALNNLAELLSQLAEKKSTNPSAIALAWLLHHPAGIVPIIGSTNPDHLIENCAADRVTLTNEEWYLVLISALKVARSDL